MIYLPNEIINKIFSFLERPATNKIMNYVIEDCYKKDYCPYIAEYWYDNFCFHYSFTEWYFLYRKGYLYSRKIYRHTPSIILVGYDKTKIEI